MNAALKLINTADKLAKRRPDRLPSNKQSEVTANLSLIARTWRTLSDEQRARWTAFGQTWSPDPKKKATISGFLAFQSLNGVRLNSGQGDIIPDAPLEPAFIGKLPAFSFVAELSPASNALTLSDAPQIGFNFNISVTCPVFAGPVLVLATRPLSAGTGQPSPRLFRQIATLPSITTPYFDVTDAYLSQFPAPAVGMKIAIQLVPISPNGFRGNPFTQTVTVTAVT